MTIGDTLKLAPVCFNDRYHKNSKLHKKTMLTGKVVYINARHRYFTAKFKLPGGSFLESFKF